MERFIGRKYELDHLDKLYSDGIQTCSVYGRRRVGKSTLLEKFCNDKLSLTIPFLENSEIENIEMINRILSKEFNTANKVNSLGEFLDIIPSLFEGKKGVVVFDELPYICNVSPYFPSLLQHFVDRTLPKTQVMLIVCGSSISSVVSELNEQSRPLFGRFLNMMEIRPLSYVECREFHPEMSDLDSLKVYLTVGGIPLYHKFMNGKTYEECVKNGFMDQYSTLRDEAENLIRRELSPYQMHSAIVSAILSGSVTVKIISEKVGVTPSLCSRYIKNLRLLGIVEKSNPLGNSSKEVRFSVCDNLVGFCYSVISSNAWLMNSNDKDEAYRIISPMINTFLGKAFERVCREYVLKHYICKEIGNWYGWTGSETAEIDIVATVVENKLEYTLMAECKFRNKVMGIDTLNTLMERSKMVNGMTNIRYLLFSISGFSEDLRDFAEDNGVMLVDLKKLYD